ncbi:hypothetical protein [Fusobacterium sp.]|uniref:hypothetical protein n=1 Tax=Fusobacterium sp. TaxID=68766 RepID=UPI0028FE6BA7|nr:hypothetical protein [Fusobacterium sp.]MDU1912397.1 hypothetical protein [Fusobacterium sp.]
MKFLVLLPILAVIIYFYYRRKIASYTEEDLEEMIQDIFTMKKQLITFELLELKRKEQKVSVSKLIRETGIEEKELIRILSGGYDLSTKEKYTRYINLVELLFLELGINKIVLEEIWKEE